jgi:hypothetical protein
MTSMVIVQEVARATLWYTSGRFWSIAGVSIGALAIVVGVVATYCSDYPRRRLYIFVSSTTSLLHRSGSQLMGLEVRDEGHVLSDPHLVTVEVISRGRRDIPEDRFDGPIVLDFGTDIVAVIESVSAAKPQTAPAPSVTTTATALHIGPTLLRRDHKLSYRVLVNGNPRVVGECPLTDVDVRHDSPAQLTNTLAELTLAAGLSFPVAGFVISLVLPLGQLISPVLALEIVGILAILAGIRLAPRWRW